MKKRDIIRAWRDGEYYASLTEEQRSSLPDNPGAQITIEDDVLSSVTGGCSIGNEWIVCPTSAYCTPCPPYQCAA